MTQFVQNSSSVPDGELQASQQSNMYENSNNFQQQINFHILGQGNQDQINESGYQNENQKINNGFINEGPSFYTPNNLNNRLVVQGTTGFASGNQGSVHTNFVASQFQYQVFYSFLENQLIESIKASLNHELFSNATFLCERLYALVQNEDVKHLMAQCYLGEGKAYKAYEILKDCQSAKNRYKFALTCIKLQKYDEAETALTGALLPQRGHIQLVGCQHLNLEENRNIPHGAPGYYLLGYVLEMQFKNQNAIESYEKALQLQPTLWCAFERLCKLLGGPEASKNRVDAVRIFTENNSDILQMNGLIREHMMNIHQHTGNNAAFGQNHFGLTIRNQNDEQNRQNQADRSKFEKYENGIIVNNFDQSPSINNLVQIDPLDQKFTIDGEVTNFKQKNSKFLQTNQKTPAPSKQIRDIKENLQSSIGIGSLDSINGAKISGAPQKQNDQSLLQMNQNGIEANKFDDDYLLIQNNTLVRQNFSGNQNQNIDYDLDKNIKTPTGINIAHQVTPTNMNNEFYNKQNEIQQNAPTHHQSQSRFLYVNNQIGGHQGNLQNSQNDISVPSHLQFDSSSKDDNQKTNAFIQSSGPKFNDIQQTIIKQNPNLKSNFPQNISQIINSNNQAGSAMHSQNLINTNAPPHYKFQWQNGQITSQQQNIGTGHVNCYTSFFSQPNIIGDPVVKPFNLSTPIQTGINQNFIANNGGSDAKMGFNIENKNGAFGQSQQINGQSASKQIGAHLLQMQLTAAKGRAELQNGGVGFDLILLLRHIGQAYQLQNDYKCQEAVQIYKKLPEVQLQTAWVSAQIARCYFELSQYEDAGKMYKIMLKQQPYRLEGLEYYSSCLWHLKDQVELCHISNQALEKNLYQPETWCILGNCYSQQKEHEMALKFYQRAIQLDPHFSYAHCLSGHEYVEIEDFEQAKKCYTEALRTNSRHYTAWWGLGNIHQKQEKYEQASYNLQQAISINSRSAILHTYLGMTFHNQNLLEDACKCFDMANQINPSNILNKYQKSQVLLTMNKDQEALNLLSELKDLLPKEAPIYINIGKIYKKFGKIKEALENFNIALDLDPKDINQVKNLIKNIDLQPDMSDEQNDLDF